MHGASGGGEDKRLKKNVEYLLVYTKKQEEFKWYNRAYAYTEIYELIQKYKEEGISWKYTSVLYKEGEEKYIASTVDGDGNEIECNNCNNGDVVCPECDGFIPLDRDQEYVKFLEKIKKI